MKEDVKRQFESYGLLKHIGEENIFRSKIDAVENVINRFDPDICSRCEERIFRECAYRPIPIGYNDPVIDSELSPPKKADDYVLD